MKQVLFAVALAWLMATIVLAEPNPIYDQGVLVAPGGSDLGGRDVSLGAGGGKLGILHGPDEPSNVQVLKDKQVHTLTARWNDTKEPSERGKIETELRAVLKQQFSEKLTVHEQAIRELEAKILQLRKQLALRKEKQNEIVEQRLQQVLRDAQGLGWGDVGSGAQLTRIDAAPRSTPASSDDIAAVNQNEDNEIGATSTEESKIPR
jgi:hypothetical protein